MLTTDISYGEVKVLFALLDSAHETGLLGDSRADDIWRVAKTSLTGIEYEREGPFLWELLNELDISGRLRGSWIQQRWHTIKLQVERSKSLTYHSLS